MRNVLFFDTMITPKIITFVYWITLICVVVAAFSTMFSSYGGGFIQGLIVLVAGIVGARIWCELLIVLFRINENLQKIANKS